MLDFICNLSIDQLALLTFGVIIGGSLLALFIYVIIDNILQYKLESKNREKR